MQHIFDASGKSGIRYVGPYRLHDSGGLSAYDSSRRRRKSKPGIRYVGPYRLYDSGGLSAYDSSRRRRKSKK